MLLYAVDDEKSFKEISALIPKLPKLPAVLVGNKLDVAREVTTEAGKDLAKDHGFEFVEVTSKDKEKVDAVFDIIIQKLAAQAEAAANAPEVASGAGDASDDKAKSKESCVIS